MNAPGQHTSSLDGPAPRPVIVAGWASLIANILIVGTGGAVRLTGSGLGCPTWPTCTDSSLVNTAEMGVHGVIEFGNRVLTILLIAIAVACLLVAQRYAPRRRDLRLLSIAVLAGIALQAGIGGLTVLLRLNPGAVGVHYLFSTVIVVAATAFVQRATHATVAGEERAPLRGGLQRTLLLAILPTAMLSVMLGTLTTGAGPHAGDEASARNGLDLSVLEHLHASAGYVLVSLTLIATILALRTGRRGGARALLVVLGLEALQIVLGITQARLGLPAVLVGGHMLIAVVIVSALTITILRIRAETPSARSPTILAPGASR